MEVTGLTISGRGLNRLINELEQEFESDAEDIYYHKSGNTAILISESFYFRVKSNLLSILVIDTADKEKYKIKIIAGGGAQGFLGITLGSESHRSEKILKVLEKICAKNEWSIKSVKILQKSLGF